MEYIIEFTAMNGSPFGRRKIAWGMAPATKFFKGRIAERET